MTRPASAPVPGPQVLRRPRSSRPLFLALAVVLAASLSGACLAAASLTPELQKQVRAATFEVVLRKPEKETATYEKPLPLELIPFVERNDKYWSIGTAFAIAPNTFVTAAHVLAAGVGSQFGTPGIRDSAGKVYPVERILKYASHEDFVVFSVVDAPQVSPLATNTEASVDDPVFAVGNALGEGVVVRDGLLTSLTPEAQDGRWKWLRFSAAASPGNSGGPLLDAQGRVIGIVSMKSPNENLNFALPIDVVLKAPDKVANFETRESFGIPKLLQGQIVAQYSDSFALPLSFPEFSTRLRATLLKYMKDQQQKLVAATAATLFPRGQSATLLAKLYTAFEPSLIEQSDDGTWDARSCEGTTTPLSGDGKVWHCIAITGVTLFRLVYPGTAVDEHRYHDSKEFMDLMLRGLSLPRMVGTQPVRMTSLGAALSDSIYRDHYGRAWQLRTWTLGYTDLQMMVLGLQTPDGYVGLATLVPTGLAEMQAERMKFLADYFYLSYTGSLSQWQAFLARSELRPAAFEHVTLQYEDGKALRFTSQRLQMDSSGIATVSPQSSLDVEMTYILDHDRLSWDVAGVALRPDRERKTFVAAHRQPKPGADADKERRERWEHMSRRDGEFTGTLQHDDQLTDFWIRTVADGSGAPDQRPLYEVIYNTDHALLPRDMEEIRARLATSFKVTE